MIRSPSSQTAAGFSLIVRVMPCRLTGAEASTAGSSGAVAVLPTATAFPFVVVSTVEPSSPRCGPSNIPAEASRSTAATAPPSHRRVPRRPGTA